MVVTVHPPPSIALRSAKQAFLARFDAFCAGAGRKPGGVSDAIFGSVRKVAKLRAGGDVWVETLALADEKLAAMAVEAGVTLPAAVENVDSDSRGERTPAETRA